MKEYILNIKIVVILLLLTACSTDELPSPNGETMRLYSMENAATNTNSAANKAVLLFWERDLFNKVPANDPFLVSKPADVIDAYKTTPYDTHTFYPPMDNIVVAVGYSPQNLHTTDYITFTLPDGQASASTDLLTSIQPVYGSASRPFDGQDKEPLKFMHAQSKVTFKAQLAEGMTLNIRKVQIRIGNTCLTGSLKWDTEKQRFTAQVETKSTSYTFPIQPNKNPLPQSTESAIEIGTIYVLPEMTSIPVEITVDKSEDNFKTFQTTTFTAELPYNISRDPGKAEDKGKVVNKLYAGEAYTFTLLFGQTDLDLIGKKEPWENGENITIPMYPNKKPINP